MRRRYALRVPFPPPVAEPAGQRELLAVREIVHALLRADRPDDVFQFALDRASPVVGASYASVYLVEGASELMRLVAAHNWPERYRLWLGAVRARVGFGPSGEAASERRAIEVPDVFADPDLKDWQEVARELGFRALITLPLQSARRVLGAVTFYFSESAALTSEKRGLLRIVADQMAATADKAGLIDELRRANAALVDANGELERQYLAVAEARREKDDFLASVSQELRAPLTAVMGELSTLHERLSGAHGEEQNEELAQARAATQRLLELIDSLLEFTALKRGTLDVLVEEFDPREPLREAMHRAAGRPEGVQLIAEEPVLALVPARTDRRKVTRILISFLSSAFRFTTRGEVRASVSVSGDRAEYRVQDTGSGFDAASEREAFDEVRPRGGTAAQPAAGAGLGLALSRAVARFLGGDIEIASAPGQGSTYTLRVPLEYSPAAVSRERA